MPILRRKLLRDIAAGKARFFAVTFLVFLGLALYISNWLGYRSLDNSYKEASEELKYNDIIIAVAQAPDDIAQELQAIDGVEALEVRLVLESGCDLPGGDSITCRLIGMPTDARPAVNDVLIEEGRYFQSGDEEAGLLEVHLAEFYDIGPGAKMGVVTPEGKQEMDVVGTAASAEFFIVSTERTMIASPRNYGVIFVPQDWLQQSFGWEGSSNQFAFLVEEGYDASEVMSRAEQVLAPYGVLSASLGDETETRQLLDLDVEGFREMSLFFPVLFLLVAALSLYMILTRMVHMQRPQVGTMMSLGVGRGRITRHYLSYAMLVGLVGGTVGIVVGYFISEWLTNTYAETLGIPLVSTVMDWGAVVLGMVMALAACFLASIIPIRRLVRLTPAQVMREDVSEVKGGVAHESFVERVFPPARRLSITYKMPLRNLSRDRRRALLNVLGIIFAIVLILVSLALMDSMNDLFGFYFNDFIQYDADVYYTTPVPQSEAQAVAQLPEVSQADPYLYVPSKYVKDGDTLGEGLLQALPQDTELVGLYDMKGDRVQLPDQGALLSDYFHSGLGIREGDTITLETAAGDLDVEVKGFVKQFGGLTTFANLAWIQQVAGSDLVSGTLVASTGLQGEELRKALLEADGVASVEIPEFTREMMRSELMGLMYVFAGLMILFAVAMALALIYNTVSIAYLEREREVSVMVALGSHLRRIAGMFTVENIIVTLLAVIPGLLAGYLLAVFMMQLFSTEFFSAPAVIRPISYVITVLGILVVVLLAEIPSLRRAKHMDVATMIRERTH